MGSVQPHRTFQERQAGEERGVPDQGQPDRDPEQRHEDPLGVAGIGEAFDERVARSLTRRLHRLEHRAFRKLKPHPQADPEQDQREQERHPPAPGVERGGGDQRPAGQDHDQAQHEPADDACLDKTGVIAALRGRRVFGDIDRRPAVFATQREALDDPQEDHDRRRGEADRRCARHHAHACGGDAHQRNGNEKGVLAPQLVAEEAEQHRAQRAKAEPHREPGPDQQQLQGNVVGGEERLADQRGERAIDEEVEPFEDRARRRGGDDQAHVGRAWLQRR